MAINSTRVIRNITEPKDSCGTKSVSSIGHSHVMTFTITTTQSSITSNSGCRIARKKDLTSPYLTGDNVKLSSLRKKKIVHKKPNDHDVSSATNLFKANSDELRSSKRCIKNVKKSVLTLPNESNTEGIICTVSDVNDVTECNKDQRDRERKIRTRKRLPIQTRKPRIRDKDLQYYDRDAKYCSQIDIDLDSSSTDMIKHFNGDGRRVSKKKAISKMSETESKLDPHDMWAVLRNINQFQFTPSPPMSDDSIQSKKKKRTNRKRNSKPPKDSRVIETCCTEEFAYISSFDVSSLHRTFSQASSVDRITVIDNQNEFSHFCQEFEKTFLSDSKNTKVLSKVKVGNQVINKSNNKKPPNLNGKPKEKVNQLMSSIEKKAISNMPSDDKNCEDADKNTQGLDIASPLSLKYKEDEFNNTLCSVNSGSSKAGLNDFVQKTKADVDKSLYSDESDRQMKGITKVILSKAPESIASKRTVAQIRKPRLVTTMPSTIPPKLTQTTIKRKLASKRYPIVILEKDELGCSSFEVSPFEPVQFRGLDQHIWPFMKDWFYNETPASHSTKNKTNNNYENTQLRKPNITGNDTNLISLKERKFNINTKKMEPKPINTIPDTKVLQVQAIKPKPMKQFKDKMLKLLYKKSLDFTLGNTQSGGQGDMRNQNIVQKPQVRVTKVDAGTDAIKIVNRQHVIQPSRPVKSPKESNQITLADTSNPTRNNFIDNVIKKIKNGIYYNLDKKNVLCKKCCKDSKEASIQTDFTIKSDEEFRSNQGSNTTGEEIPIEESIIDKTIPGFDEVLAPVEIKSLDMKQITVKHCFTNILMQFDIAAEMKAISLDSPRSLFTPLVITDSQSKIIKCKKTIINAIMPAELCSIIPKMMRNLNLNPHLQMAFSPILSRNAECLSPISELTPARSNDFSSITPFTFMSLKLKSILTGAFSLKKYNDKDKFVKNKISIDFHSNDRNIVKEIFNEIECAPLLCGHEIVCQEITTREAARNLSSVAITPQIEPSKCMALQTYNPPEQCVTPTLEIQNVVKLLQHFCSKNIVVNFDFPKYFPVMLNDIKITVFSNNYRKNALIDNELMSRKIKVDSLFNGFLKSGDCKSKSSHGCLDENVNCAEFQKYRIQEKKPNICQNLCHNKAKKKCFVRLYKKCKSTSNISMERSSTAISKISNLDHFFQALGSGKQLSSVFDGYTEKKILSFIGEMKNWITEISQRQAMLVLLLTNKKDTPNLVRFRPVLLQGIAVNRITRASELDMEIEVIETENLNKRQYEGISYVTASDQSNNLLEELYWIAKTTASDYQKPFDESSERLLKSLTEKRKKLNPSYLRVMARYVGLGLLKPPKK